MKLRERIKLIARRRLEDDRGWFVKVIDGHEPHLPAATGEVYVALGKPGQVRGGHYHREANEWFTIVVGCAEAVLADAQAGEELSLRLSAGEPQTLFVPAGVAHAFRNAAGSSEDFVLVAYTDRLYEPDDTVPYTFGSEQR